MTKGAFGGTNIDVTKEGESFGITILVHGIIDNVHVTLVDLDNFDN